MQTHTKYVPMLYKHAQMYNNVPLIHKKIQQNQLQSSNKEKLINR